MSAQPQPTRTYDFQGGQPAVADAVDTDLNTLYTVLQAGIGNTHIASDAAIDFSKLASAAWTSYTPTMAGITTEGNATKSGFYIQIGKIVIAKGKFTAGSTTDATGTGTPITMSLPITGKTASADVGSAIITDNSAGNVYQGTTLSSTTVVNFYLGVSDTQAMAAGHPTGVFTAGAGNSTSDSITFTHMYEAA